MKKINRRQFIGKSVLATGAALPLSQLPSDLLSQLHVPFKEQPIGFQTFPIRDMLAKDFAGTLKMMAGLGYKLVEMCSPPGYANIGFGPLVNMKTSEMRSIINDSGLICTSCHFGFVELKEKLDDRIEFAQQLGLKLMVCSTFSLPATATMKDYLDAADTLNNIAK